MMFFNFDWAPTLYLVPSADKLPAFRKLPLVERTHVGEQLYISLAKYY